MIQPRRAIIDTFTGLVNPPIFPCYKGEGLCKYRVVETDKFECLCTPSDCRGRARGTQNQPDNLPQ